MSGVAELWQVLYTVVWVRSRHVMEFFQLVILTFAAAVHASMKNIRSHHAGTKTLYLM